MNGPDVVTEFHRKGISQNPSFKNLVAAEELKVVEWDPHKLEADSGYGDWLLEACRGSAKWRVVHHR